MMKRDNGRKLYVTLFKYSYFVIILMHGSNLMVCFRVFIGEEFN